MAWLDREIKAAEGTLVPATPAPPTANSTPLPPAAATKPRNPGDAAAAERAAEEIIAQYKEETQALHSNVRRGCFIYFSIALALLGVGVLILYLLRTKH